MSPSQAFLHSTDVLIVGAGITGLTHAAEAIRQGLRVSVIDRDARAVGASIRNFGHCCITAQSGELLELARTAREGWLRHSSLAGFFAVESGGIAVARTQTEMDVLEELAAVRSTEEITLLGPSAARAQLSDTADAAILGGAILHEDIRVDPREAAGKLASWLEEQPGVRFLWRTSYLGTDDAGTRGAMARTSRGLIQASRVIVCVGHDLDHLHPDVAASAGVQRCALQMALVRPPSNLRIEKAVLTGTSMLRYPAFAITRAAQQLRQEMTVRSPELLAIDANLMMTQRPDGTLIIGDSHHIEATVDPFLSEATTDTLLAAAARLLGVGSLHVLERWQGIYASSPQQSFLIKEIQPNVTAVSVTSGIGMTISFGLARTTFAQLHTSSASPEPALSH